MKKTLALLLALTLIMSVLVIPAAAASTYACPTCSRICGASYLKTISVIRTVQSCNENSDIHNHYVYYDVFLINCPNHGEFTFQEYSHYVCP